MTINVRIAHGKNMTQLTTPYFPDGFYLSIAIPITAIETAMFERMFVRLAKLSLEKINRRA